MKLLQGDCLEVMKQFSENSIDAICCDPPYGLSFMGKKWDYDVPSLEIWQECLRVLKPGGYLLSFAGTRTQHRMAVRIEDAGFEIRDMIAWVYGSGFPKSLNIGKAVDKLQGNEREVLPPKTFPDGSKDRKTANHKFYADVENQENNFINTKGTSEWEGWGTALKPALEPITVARKPLAEKTVAENCLKWGVGGINIDECRVEGLSEKELNWTPQRQHAEQKTYHKGVGGAGIGSEMEMFNKLGRFPANLIHDGSDEVVELFPNSNGSGKARKLNRSIKPDQVGWGMNKNSPDEVELNDAGSGSAARFFYCAKASKRERNMGCEGLDKKEKVFNGQSDKPSVDMKGVEKRFTTQPKANNHPTVKPISLMEYLVKLVSREGHTILDPFMGSGTTGIACKKLNRHFIGIEREPDYITIAENRIEAVPKTLF